MSIRTLLDMINSEELVLPAMQRPFVWEEERIRRLMDSLMRNFPIGTVLIWETDEAQRFRPFTREYHSDNKSHVNFPEAKTKRLKFVLDGQQRLTSLNIASRGTHNGRWLYLDLLSGVDLNNESDHEPHRDPGEMYFDFQFFTGQDAADANAASGSGEHQKHFKPFRDFLNLDVVQGTNQANALCKNLKLTEKQSSRVLGNYTRAVNALQSTNPLQVFVIDEFGQTSTSIAEILELFVRINSSGMPLLKSDLLMSLLDLKWNDIQPELLEVARAASQVSPIEVDRDLVLKSALLVLGEESRFDKLVKDRKNIERVAPQLQDVLPKIHQAWLKLGVVLTTRCKIHSPRFFRQATNALLPFVSYLAKNPNSGLADENRIVAGIYIALMSGVFGAAEARMGSFTKKYCLGASLFPLEELAEMTMRVSPVKDLDSLLGNHLDLALNIVHGGVIPDANNPDQLERDHIFPKARLADLGYSKEQANHYANFHFLRFKDNRNKTDKPPHEWFAKPGPSSPAYTDEDLAAILIDRSEIQPGEFDTLVANRGKRMREAACKLFRMTEAKFNALFQ